MSIPCQFKPFRSFLASRSRVQDDRYQNRRTADLEPCALQENRLEISAFGSNWCLFWEARLYPFFGEFNFLFPVIARLASPAGLGLPAVDHVLRSSNFPLKQANAGFTSASVSIFLPLSALFHSKRDEL